MGTVVPIRYGSRQHAVLTMNRLAERKEERRQMYVRRRRRWLWNPLCLVGAVLVIWQVTSWTPTPVLLYLGGLMLIPWVVDV